MAGKKQLISSEQIEASKERRRAWDRERHAKNKEKRNKARREAHAKNPTRLRKIDKERYALNPHTKKRNDIRYRYGSESYEVFLVVHQCQACGDEVEGRNKHIDHDHSKPKSFRGILCGACNVALGYLKEDETRILGLLNYIQTKGTKS